MDNIIETRDAADAPQANAEIPQDTMGIDVTAGQDGNLFPPGGNEAITNEGLPVGSTAPIETSEQPLQTEEPVQTEAPAKDDSNRMEYWQSQADQAKNEAYKLKEELGYYKNTLDPIARVIETNPQVLNNIESLSNGSSSNAEQQTPQQRNPLAKPSKPEKPHSYNEVDAYNDPESDSFKYRMGHDKWRDDMIGWYGNIDQARQQQAHVAQQQQAKVNMVNSAHTTAMNQYGMDARSATDFVQWAQNPANITYDALIKLYQLKDAPQQQTQSQAQQKTQQMQTQQERLKVPRPTAVQPGQSAPVATAEDSFNMALLNNGKRR